MNALITGTDSGLGKDLFEVFQARTQGIVLGTTVGIPDDDESELYELNVTRHSAVEDSVRGVEAFVRSHVRPGEGGKLDILINNIGINAIREFESLDEDFINHVMAVNFILPVLITQECLPFFRNGGRVINIVSEASWKPMRHSLAYNCSKAALRMATLQMARELTKPYGVSIIAVHPGKLAGTEMTSYIDKHIRQTRGWTEEENQAYQAKGRVTPYEQNTKALAKLIYDIATSDLFPSMSGAMMDVVG